MAVDLAALAFVPPDTAFALEMTAAAVLRALGVAGKTADALACKRLDLLPDFPEGLLAATLPVADETEAKATRSRPRRPRASG